MPAVQGVGLDELDGKRIFDAFSSGAQLVIDNQEHLNRINVFPVPDGDTGTNLAATLSHIIGSTRVTDSIGETVVSMSDAAIVGARGNSGAIFAQFLSGLSEGVSFKAMVTLESFALAVLNARNRAYEAISNPKEGTILSVISEWSRSLLQHARDSRTFHELFDRTLPAVEESLRRTPEQLPVLKRAGVVDAGAQGFYHFVRGARDFFLTGKKPLGETLATLDLDSAHDVPASEESITHRYCAEVMLRLERGSAAELRPELEPLGDSLIIVSAGQKARVHIHTDRPADLVALLGARGGILQQKADDMRMQFATVHRRKHSIALLTDSACDLPQKVLDEHQIHVVPLRILAGGTEYIDRVTITPAQLERLQRSAHPYPSTSQPPAAEIHHAYAWLSRHYDSVIAIHISGKMSGTCAASRREAEKIPGARITVIDSRHLSGSLGLLVLRAAEAISSGAGHNEVVQTIESSIHKANILVSVRTLDYMVRGGRVSPLKGMLAKLMNLKPIVSVDAEGSSLLHGQAFSTRANLGKILGMVAGEHRAHPLRCYAVIHAGAPEAARQFASRLKEIIGRDPLFIMEISPVIRLNAGPGAVSVVTMQE
jgi:DegV family protein with EDD domain